ncbi:MAG: glycoside hydrolase family 3 protein [Alphaproteobacteria bacterium]|nr:glycoside hydrolase family 3 protein [Alphaproteobacteria bacterium SS10]
MTTRPCAMIIGVAGHQLTDEEHGIIEQTQPFGFILFKRNCQLPRQVRDLCNALKASVKHDPPILIDQEGGRVNRLASPPWPKFPAPGSLGVIADAGIGTPEEAAYWHARLTGEVLRNLNVTVNCAPVLDVPAPDSDPVVLGDRCYSDEPEAVSGVGLHAVRGFREAGIVPVIKHLPGHGRATVDSHHALPVISASLDELEATDFKPFNSASLFYREQILGMTGHLLLPEVDELPVSISTKLINEVIREKIGFKGHLMADDLSMGALTSFSNGSIPGLGSAAIEAGCDSVLFCAPKLEMWTQLADRVGEISKRGWDSWQVAARTAAAAITPMDAETFMSHHRRWLTPATLALSNQPSGADPTSY